MAVARLHVEASGSGRAVVLAHGFGGSARNWRPQLRALRDRYRVVSYDARGHARSEAPPGAGAYRLDELVGDLAGVVAGCGDPRPVVGGLSLGAATALGLALAGRVALRGLVLASLPAGPASGRGISARAQEFAAAIDALGLEPAGERYAWGPDSGLDAQGAALVRQGFLEHSPAALAHLLRETLARLASVEELAPQLARCRIPTLVVAGAADTASLPTCRALAAALPDARLVEVPGAGHVVNLAQPEAFNASLIAFLDGLPD